MAEIKKYDRKAAFTELKEYCTFAKEHDFVEVSEWYNGEGFDVSMNTLGENTIFQLTFGQFKAIKKLVKALEKE